MKLIAMTRGVLVGAVVAGLSSVATAGQGFYVQVVNDLKEDITIQMTNRYNPHIPSYKTWYPEGFAAPSVVAAGAKRIYYTEVCESAISCRMGERAYIQLEAETQRVNWRAAFDLSYVPGSDKPRGSLTCSTVYKQGGDKAPTGYVSLRKDGKQYVAIVKLTEQGVKCE